MVELGVNIDHVATVRQARRTYEPDPVAAAYLAELGGADGITFHLREDRRHIQDRDVRILKETISVHVNMEFGCVREIVDIACDVKPDWALLVPESREEVTTEGGLNVADDSSRAADAIKQLHDAGIAVSLFLDPDLRQIESAAALGVGAVELHTGPYALAKGEAVERELQRLKTCGQAVLDAGMRLHAGHGLTYKNVHPVAAIPHIRELNIGHSIIARAVMVGIQKAVADMKHEIEVATRAKSV
ncbi:pyridoxine 5'-phosphate synthase [Rosistilla oblonga]|uniref:pyridoxine 5'-phosphate synthase n=1 Tax=Rosistilla oblonga TaxID=2527990 RepID=UPI003A96AF2B